MEWSGEHLEFSEAAKRAPVLGCPECGGTMRLKDSQHGFFYGCDAFPSCRCTHGAHPDGKPKGYPGNAATRAARIKAHAAFDALWKRDLGGTMPRRRAYARLREAFPSYPLHIAEMTEGQALEVARWAPTVR